MRRMRTAGNIYKWAREQMSTEKGAWALANPERADALDFAFKCAKELGYDING